MHATESDCRWKPIQVTISKKESTLQSINVFLHCLLFFICVKDVNNHEVCIANDDDIPVPAKLTYRAYFENNLKIMRIIWKTTIMRTNLLNIHTYICKRGNKKRICIFFTSYIKLLREFLKLFYKYKKSLIILHRKVTEL